jgi:hypothetical protein
VEKKINFSINDPGSTVHPHGTKGNQSLNNTKGCVWGGVAGDKWIKDLDVKKQNYEAVRRQYREVTLGP